MFWVKITVGLLALGASVSWLKRWDERRHQTPRDAQRRVDREAREQQSQRWRIHQRRAEQQREAEMDQAREWGPL